MKNNFLTLLFILSTTLTYAQKYEVSLNDLNAKGNEIKDNALKQAGVGNNKVLLTIKDVAKEEDFADYKFFLGDKEKIKKSDLSGIFVDKDNTYVFDLTTMVKNMETSQKFKIKNKEGIIRYSYDITTVTIIDTDAECTQLDFQTKAQTEFQNKIYPNYQKKYGLGNGKNLNIDKNNIVHIFIDHYGQYYGYGAPTTATEKYTYQVHLITATCLTAKYQYLFDYTGNYNPTFNIEKGTVTAQAGDGEIEFRVIDFAVIGPFTEKVMIDVKKAPKTSPTDKQTILHVEIPIAKLYHVSITTGLLGSFLRNPQNIERKLMPNSTDYTLYSDDPTTRGMLTVMAVYYPKGRSFLYPPTGGIFDPSRMGVVVGTQLGEKAKENFFLGLSNDFARGGAITYGIHYGRRTFLPDKRDFEYGKTVYDLPEVISKQEWNASFFIGASIDTRVAIELIKSLTTP